MAGVGFICLKANSATGAAMSDAIILPPLPELEVLFVRGGTYTVAQVRAIQHQTALAIQDERDALRAEVEGLRADAERYRWLTDDHQSWDTRNEVARIAQDITIHGKGYTDAAIDAAIAARKP